MLLPVTEETMLSELWTSKEILEAWIAKIEAGIPGMDLPAPPERLADFVRAFCGELLIVSGKCENMSNVLSEET